MTSRWLGVVEGFYGPPLAHEDRLDLLAWISRWGFTSYAYAPKDDPLHRTRWRERYGDEDEQRFADLLAHGRDAGVDVALVLSPGLDWRDGDERPLIEKLRAFRDVGAGTLGIAWDDVPPGGADLGTTHGRAVAAAMDALDGDVRWVTCPTDYATATVTPYLSAYAAAVPPEAEIMWTGPSIVSPEVPAGQAGALGEALGRPLIFAENFPVNDGPMSDVLHLGPYPERPASLVEETAGVFCNLMPRSRASWLGLAAAARFWTDPTGDREQVWREVLDELPGLAPLARACRSWATDGAPDAELAAWAEAALQSDGADTRLRDHLVAGCRDGLDPRLAAELEPWLDQWDAESQAMQFALQLVAARPGHPLELAMVTAELWRRARKLPAQVFGVRWAYYPVTEWDGRFQARADALVTGENLTDRLCRAALSGGPGGGPPGSR